MQPQPLESVAPTRSDPVVAAASQIIGGPLGRHAARTRHTARSVWQPAAAVLIGLASLTVASGVLQKAHCFSRGWNTPDQFWHTCYSDLPIVYQTAGLGRAMPYLSGAQPLDQPLISGLALWVVGLAVPDGTSLAQQQWYFALWAAVIAVIVMALVVVTAASVPRAPWRAAHVALSPVLVLAGLLSADLLGVLLASLALLAWGRNRIPLAGVLLGLAVSARSYPLVLLVAIGLLAVRSGQLQPWRRLALTTLATWLAVSLPWLVINPDALTSVYRTWWNAGASYGSIWVVPSLLDHGLPTGAVTVLALVGWITALCVGAYVALSLDRRPSVAEISLIMLVIVIVTGKAVPVQAALWLLPLIALVGLGWRDHLIWAGFEVVYFVAVWLYIGGLSRPERGLPQAGYSFLLGLRLLAMVFVLLQVWRVARSRWPVEPVDREPLEADRLGGEPGDAVGEDGVDQQVEETDPLAGPMAGASDRVLVRLT